MSAVSATSPVDLRDFRSATRPFKRDKDHGSKWADGVRPGAGVKYGWNSITSEEVLIAGSESQKEKVRPRKTVSQSYSNPKPHANKTPKQFGGGTWYQGRRGGRVAHQVDAHFEAQQDDNLSNSILELLPNHVNNTIQSPAVAADSEVLYSFEKKGPSPAAKGNKVDLGGLVDKAEKRWVAEQTEKIVRGEYEVLDLEGEKTVLKKGKRSPRQKAVKDQASAELVQEDEDGFQLV